MKTLGHITQAQANAALAAPVTLKPFFKERGATLYFVDYLRKDLELRYGRAALARGGLRIYTTLDLELQRTAAEVLQSGVKGIEKKLTGRRKGKGPQRDPAGLEGALVAIEPATGEIRVMVGGWTTPRASSIAPSRHDGSPAPRSSPSCMRRRSTAVSRPPRLWTIFRPAIPSQERCVRGVEPGE